MASVPGVSRSFEPSLPGILQGGQTGHTNLQACTGWWLSFNPLQKNIRQIGNLPPIFGVKIPQKN